jgi:hypothetical protein
MSDEASYVRAPRQNATGDVSTAKFTAGTSSAANAIPREWAGHFVRITVEGGDLHYLFTANASAEVDRAVSATAAGASGATVGDILLNGQSDHVRVPERTTGEIYFVREATASATVYIRRSS